MSNQVRVPHMEMRDGKPANNYIKVGPFTLHESNKGNYFLYTVRVTDDVVIYKRASRPNLYDICHALKEAFNEKRISKEVFLDYRDRADVALRAVPDQAAVQQRKAAQKKGKR